MAFEVRFKDESLEELQEENAAKDKAYPAGVGKRFRKSLNWIRGATCELDLYQLKGLGFEKLKGKRQHQCSMKLNDQWRLILQMEGSNPTIVWIVGIEDYH
jgi:proteic killer suppression protein